jgi:hypothetical protein
VVPGISGTTRRRAGGSRGGLGGVASAGKDGKPRIFGEGWIGLRELAEEELRAFAGFDEAGVETIGAEAESRVGAWR